MGAWKSPYVFQKKEGKGHDFKRFIDSNQLQKTTVYIQFIWIHLAFTNVDNIC